MIFKNVLIVVLGCCFTMSALAKDLDKLGEKKVIDFPTFKNKVLLSIEEREVILRKEKECVAKSSNELDMKNCFKAARYERQEVGKKIKEKN